MLILTIRTDKPEAEMGLFDDQNQIAYETWQAHKHLSETIHLKIEELLKSNNIEIHDINAIVAYKGPGSFTGLRIGLAVANSLAFGLGVPIAGGGGEDWRVPATDRLLKGENDKIVAPDYGAEAHITQQKK